MGLSVTPSATPGPSGSTDEEEEEGEEPSSALFWRTLDTVLDILTAVPPPPPDDHLLVCLACRLVPILGTFDVTLFELVTELMMAVALAIPCLVI